MVAENEICGEKMFEVSPLLLKDKYQQLFTTCQQVVFIQDVKYLNRSVVQASPKMELDDSQTTVMYTRADNEWPSDDEEEEGHNGTKWDSEGVGKNYNQYYKLDCPLEDECWDIEMEGEQEDKEVQQDNWSSWRETNAHDECEHDRTRKDIFAERDYQW